jgi:tripartite-type tricarboxylate transporter receptor subunit TctC
MDGRSIAIAFLSTSVALQPGVSATQSYPAKPVKVVAAAQPGGGVDLIARTVAEQLSRSMAQSFIVENISGGGSAIGSQAVARAAPDGYTLMVGNVSSHSTNPAVRKVPYDPVKDFTAIAMVGGTPNVLVVKGLGNLPSIVGRSPSYVVRQLYDIQSGARAGTAAQLMKATVANLTVEDMASIAAYLASRSP